jgi:hypothetical protein
MDQLFKALPRDLQWEILTEFVGTHKVRNGKLLRKMPREHHVQSINKAKGIIPLDAWLKDRRMHLMYKTTNPSCTLDGLKVLTILVPVLNNWASAVHLCETPSGELIYIYDTKTSRFKIPLDDKNSLPPFIKNEYHSYPYTDKKKNLKTITHIYRD